MRCRRAEPLWIASVELVQRGLPDSVDLARQSTKEAGIVRRTDSRPKIGSPYTTDLMLEGNMTARRWVAVGLGSAGLLGLAWFVQDEWRVRSLVLLVAIAAVGVAIGLALIRTLRETTNPLAWTGVESLLRLFWPRPGSRRKLRGVPSMTGYAFTSRALWAELSQNLPPQED